MKKFTIPIIFLAVSAVFCLSGCQKQDTGETDESRPVITEPLPKQLEIEPTEEKSDGMVLYSSCPFLYREAQWELQALVQEDMIINEELALDDRGRFRIQAVSGETSYVFLDEMVQLGIPEADVWIDEQEILHIVLRDVRTAQYKIVDFIYEPELKKFIGADVMNEIGINYLGTTGI